MTSHNPAAHTELDQGAPPRPHPQPGRLKRMMAEGPRHTLIKAYFYGCLYAARMRRGLFERKPKRRLVFSPTLPQRPYLQWKIAALVGLRPQAPKAGVPATVMYSLDATGAETGATPPPGALNGGAVDISKSRVMRVFEEVFGYGLEVDPRTYAGPIVAKGEQNAAYDGSVVEGPIDNPLPNTVYQVAVDNTQDDGTVEDLRSVVVGSAIPIVFRKHRPITNRFSNDNTHVEIVEAAEVFSEEERALIIKFARAFGVDLGELDVLRDRKTGRIYIVDVATTPHTPPELLVGRPGLHAVRVIARTFEDEFLSPSASDSEARPD